MRSKEEKSFFPLKRLIIIIIIGLAIVFAINRILAFLEGPSAGEPKATESAQEPAEEAETTRELVAKHFSLLYASKLDTVSDISGGDKTALEIYRVASREITSRRTLTITIKKLPPDAFEGESSYLLRHRNPTEYTENTVKISDAEYVVLEKSDGSEVVAFNRFGDKMAILAYTVSSTDKPPRTELQELLAGFRWR